jgi:hypothetical protein
MSAWDLRVIRHSALVAALQPRTAPGDRTPWRAAPPEESITRGGRGGGGGEAPPHRGPRRTRLQRGRCPRYCCCRRCRAFASRRCSQSSAADILGCRYSSPLAVAPLLLRQLLLLLLLLQLPWGVGVCVGVHRWCCRHCHGGNLAVIVDASAAVAAAIGGGRTYMIAS